MTDKDLALEHAVVEFYREEIRLRYQLDNIRRFEPFEDITDEHLNGLRDFFVDSIYPAAEKRQGIDDAFEHLHALLRSPRRLKPLMTMALASMWRLGTQLPAAVSAGLTTVDALRETRKLEAKMMDVAEGLGLSPAEARKRDAMVQIIANVPEKVVLHLIYDVLHLFRALSNVKMLGAMLEIMERSVTVMDKRQDVYRDDERKGVALGMEIVHGGHALFNRLQPDEFPKIIKGVELVELDWFDRIRKEAAA